MFDLTSSKLLILGVVALIVVGPKELPFLLRTIGKYVGMIRRQANEFRAQFDEAMREAELDSIRKDVENVARDAENSLRDAGSSVDREIHASQQAVDEHGKPDIPKTDAATVEPVHPPMHTYDPLNGLETGQDHPISVVVPPAVPKLVDAHDHAIAANPAPVLAKTGT